MKNFLLALSVLCSTFILAQKNNPNQNLNFPITFLDTEPTVDGNILGEAIWEQVPAITDLKQIKPNYNAPASEETAIRVAYTNKTLGRDECTHTHTHIHIYVMFVCGTVQ